MFTGPARFWMPCGHLLSTRARDAAGMSVDATTQPLRSGPARRTIVRGAAVGAVVATARVTPFATARAEAAPRTGFLHGVASGDPLPTAVVLWTRVTPSADATPGSAKGERVRVVWEIATDESFTTLVRTGHMSTGTERDHTVSVDATGLTPATRYAYRFRSGGRVSPTGWTRTAPEPSSTPSALRLGVVSSSGREGQVAAYRHLARHDLDAVLHMGDDNDRGRAGEPAHDVATLADHRERHGRSKSDPDLQQLHAAVPWITTWRDRGAAARQAHDEWMPVRPSGEGPHGDDHRSLSFGTLADLSLLDLRSSSDTSSVGWLKSSLSRSQATWKLVGNPVMIAPVTLDEVETRVGRALHEMGGVLSPEDGDAVEQADGYTADRREVVDHLADQAIDNTLFLTGGIHSAWASDVPHDVGSYPSSGSVAVEFIGTSVSPDNLDDILGVEPRTVSLGVESAIRTANLHVRYLDLDRHGYSVLTLTPGRAQMDWYALTDHADPDTGVRWRAGFETLPGRNRATRVWYPALGD